jgi:hypothetical protein
MKSIKMGNRLVGIFGLTGAGFYLICTTIAYLLYPLPYNPFENWLSDLGNPLVNGIGAITYNLGCIVAALALIFFSIGLYVWNDGNKTHRILIIIAQVTNIISAISLIIIALFPLGTYTQVHQVFGKIHIIFAGFFLTFSATVLLRVFKATKWLGIFGFAIAVVNFLYGAFLYEFFIAEWFAIGLFILFVILLSIHSLGHAIVQNSVVQFKN